MKTTVLVLFVAIALIDARPQEVTEQLRQYWRTAQIIRYIFENYSEVGKHYFDVETSDGFQHKQGGEPVEVPNEPEPVQAVAGEYSYVGPDGKTYRVEYVADQDGFHPAGEHLHGASTSKDKPRKLGIPSAALASLAGGGLGK